MKLQEMNRDVYIMTVLEWMVCLVLTACPNYPVGRSQTGTGTTDSFSTSVQETNAEATYGQTVQQDQLAGIYTQAIAEFIKVAFKKDKSTYDTLFFGRHVYGQPDDFPDIELPETIENTQVRLITPEAGLKKQQERRSLVYINMMGWVDEEKAEFILVVFSNGGEHQHDYFINFTFNAARKEFELQQIQSEDYQRSNGQNPERITIYKEGKYTGDW